MLRLLILVIGVSSAVAIMPGGITDTDRPIDSELKLKLEQVQPQVEAAVENAINGPVWTLKPVAYRSQVVAGVMYYVKYRLNDSEVYYDAKIFQDLGGGVNLVKISGRKTEADPIAYMP